MPTAAMLNTGLVLNNVLQVSMAFGSLPPLVSTNEMMMSTSERIRKLSPMQSMNGRPGIKKLKRNSNRKRENGYPQSCVCSSSFPKQAKEENTENARTHKARIFLKKPTMCQYISISSLLSTQTKAKCRNAKNVTTLFKHTP